MTGKDRRDATISHTVQLCFLIGVMLLWYFATNDWGVNHLLLPNPIEVF